MDINLEALGFTQEELQERVVSKIADGFLYDEDGEYLQESNFSREIQGMITEAIDRKVTEAFEKNVLPQIELKIDELILQDTNQWGEKQRDPLTFIEYLIKRSEAYLHEKVDYEGKSKEESRGYSWSATQTRLAHLVHHHLHYEIERAMKSAVKTVQDALAPALAETVKIQLKEISEKLKVDIKTGR